MAKDHEGRPLGKGGKRRTAEHLSEDERALWEHAARDLKPLKTKKSRVHTAQEDDAQAVESAARRAPHAEKHVVHKPSAKHAPAPSPAQQKKNAPPPLAPLDRRKARKIGSGRIEVEGRIDLHGMRQSEAHQALRRFLLSSHAQGRRWVLVITGKGNSQRRRPNAEEDFGYGEEERGVLKRNVPRWLAEPELRTIVVGYMEAAIRHGGGGALYVQLRRRDRPDAAR